MNREALLNLRRVTENIPDHRLHMRNFVEEAECGTAGCIFGFFAADKWARENTDVAECFDYDPIKRTITLRLDQSYQVFPYAERIFDISEQDSDALFAGDASTDDGDPHAVSKQEVLDNIDRILRGEPARVYDAYRDDKFGEDE